MCKDVKFATNGRYLAAADMIDCRRVSKVKLGKDVPFYYFSWGTFETILLLRLPSSHNITVGAFAAPAPQLPNQVLGGFNHVFKHYVPGGRRVGRAAFSDIGQDFATVGLRLAPQCLGSAPKDWADAAEETAEKNCPYRVLDDSTWGRSRRDRSPEYLDRDPPDFGTKRLMNASL